MSTLFSNIQITRFLNNCYLYFIWRIRQGKAAWSPVSMFFLKKEISTNPPTSDISNWLILLIYQTTHNSVGHFRHIFLPKQKMTMSRQRAVWVTSDLLLASPMIFHVGIWHQVLEITITCLWRCSSMTALNCLELCQI